jgi:hypothetical protein
MEGKFAGTAQFFADAAGATMNSDRIMKRTNSLTLVIFFLLSFLLLFCSLP